MTLNEFKDTLTQETPPPVSLPLRALWHEGRGDWTASHDLLQNEGDGAGAWVHAYLHRKEGDTSNAGYWYVKAGRSRPADDVTLRGEWDQIARELLGDQPKV